MSGFRLGSFEVVEKIASGGMGDIWSGTHVVQGVTAAIKVIRQNGTQDIQFKKAFRHEVRAVAQLDHPGIITLFDIGEVPEAVTSASAGALETGSPYLVMEYLERGSLDSLEFPLPWPRTREILMAVLSALAHAHARGITHRDLKPGNILLAEEQTGSPIRVADFGIAFSYRESSSSEAEGRVVGTPAYMAPEQFMGEWRDFGPWTDLYALGCVAYQLASGRVPFEQQDLMELGSAHIRQPPPDLECAPDYPAGFGDWVTKLLHKDPAARYRRCAEAASVLTLLTTRTAPRKGEASAAAAVTDGSEATEPVRVPSEKTATESGWIAPFPPQPPFRLIGTGLKLFGLRSLPMIDRDEERDRLWRTFARVSEQGMPRFVVLEGSAGCGKSRLAEWFCERTHEMNLAQYLKVEHDRSRSRESGLSHMLAEAWSCLEMPAHELQDRVRNILMSAGIRSGTMRKTVAELLAPASLGDDFRPGTFHEFPSRAARFSALFEVLRDMYGGTPFLVWLDDVHWGIDALHFLRYVSNRSRTEPIPMMAVLTARDDLLVESPEAAALLRELCSGETAERIHVDPLSNADSRLLVSSLLHLHGDLAERVSARSGGNPMYATQLVGDWVARGILEPGASGFVLSGTSEPEIPDDVHAVWVRRFERVLDECTSGAARRIEMQVAMELAAALDGLVNMAEWGSVCSLAGIADPGPVLESLLAAQMARIGIDGWSFSQSMVRESIERIARERGRWASHNRLCADMLERHRPVPHWGDSERIGRHRFEAAQLEAAVGPLLRGAKERLRLEEYSAALESLGRCDQALDGLDAPEGDLRRLDAWLLRADIHYTRRELSAAEELADRVKALADRPEARRYHGAALVALARVHWQQGQLSTALAEFEEAQATLRTTGPKQSLAACLSEQAHATLEMGILDRAWQAFNEAQEIYEEIGQIVPWAENQLGLARVALRQGNPDHAATLCNRVRAFANREGLSRIEANAWRIFSDVQLAEGRRVEAERSLEESITLVEQLGLTRQAFHSRLLRALLWLESGAVHRAKVEVEQLRGSPDIDIPRVARSLMHCVDLAIAIGDSPSTYRSSLAVTAASLAEADVVTPDVERCLLVAVERATTLGFPERATQVSQLRTNTSTQPGDGDAGPHVS